MKAISKESSVSMFVELFALYEHLASRAQICERPYACE